MAAIKDVNFFQRFPRNVRNLIYKYHLPWFTFDGCAHPDIRRSKPFHPEKKVNRLGILRTSWRVYTEFRDMMYEESELTIGDFNAINHRGYSEQSNQNFLKVSLSHKKFGLLDLPRLEGPAQSTSAKAFSNLPHHLWERVNVDISSVDLGNPEGYVICWRGIELLVGALNIHFPRALHIHFPEKLHEGDPKNYSRDFNSHYSFVRLLQRFRQILSPDTQLPLMYLHAPSTFTIKLLGYEERGECECMDRLFESSSWYENRTFPLLQRSTIALNVDELNQLRCPSYPHLNHHDYLDVLMNWQLQVADNEFAKLLRIQQFLYWTMQYELDFIAKIRSIPEEKCREKCYSALAERWAVWRVIRTNSHERDLRNIIEDPHDFSSSSKYKSSLLAIECRRNSRRWKQLKLESLYYDRRILITTAGIQWDPSSYLNSVQQQSTLVRGEVLFMNIPPAKPVVRPSEQEGKRNDQYPTS